MLAEQIANIDSIEDLFAIFKLDFDKHAVNVYRLQMLKYFGQLVEELEARNPAPDESERDILYVSALLNAHDRYALGDCCCEPPVFAGLRQRLVQLSPRRREM
jgi:hypothetical protein